jgi:hypothetical protein
MGSVLSWCGYLVNTLFVRCALSCVNLSTYSTLGHTVNIRLFITRYLYSAFRSLHPRIYPQRYGVKSICYRMVFTQYPQGLLLLQRSYLKER